MQGSLLGCSSGKFKGFSDQVLFAPILLYFLIAATMSSCGFVDDAGEGVNTPPSVSVQTGDLIVNEQSPVTLNSSVTDDFASVDSISWQQTTGPEVQLRDADSEQASFTSPAVLVHESPLRLQFRIVVRDNFGQEGNDSIVVLVNADNILPVANDDSGLVVNEGQPGEPAAVINVTANDSDEDGSVSPEGIKIVTQPELGQAVPNDDGTVSYIHDGTEPSAKRGTDTDSFTYRVKDNETVLADEARLGEALIYSNEATVSVTITPVNDPPVAETATVVLDEGQTASGLLTATDVDSEFVFFLASQGTLGTVSVANDGAFSYVPNNGDVNGSDQFTFGVKEIGGEELDSTALVSVTINPINDAPRITSRPVIRGREEVRYVYNISAKDVEDNAMAFSATSLPAWLTLTDNGNGTAVLSGTPNNNDAGSYGLTVRVTDNGSPPATGTQRVNIRVAESNLAPRFTSNAVTSATEGQIYTYNITAADRNGDALTITAPVLPGWLSLTDNDDGSAVLRGTPAEDDAGNHNVTLRVSDDGNPVLAANQSFTLVVSESNEAPRFTSTGVGTATEGTPYSYSIAATDPNGDALTITAPRLPGWLNLNDNGDGTALLSGTPGGDDVGNHAVTVRLTDDGSPPLSVDQSFNIVVSGTNQAPVANNDTVSVTREARATIDVLGNDTDVDGTINPATVVIVTQPANGIAVVNADGTVTYAHNGSRILIDRLAYTVQDNDGATSNVATVSLSITSLDGFDAQQAGCWATRQEQPLRASLNDPEVSALAMYTLVNDATKGTVSITDPLTGTFRYDPDPEGERGADTFIYRIDDPQNEVKIKRATVIVNRRIMFLGDFITAGISDSVNQLPAQELRGGFRKPFYDALFAEGYRIDLVGSQSGGAGLNAFDPQHEAHSDWTILELAYGRNPEDSEGVFAWLEANPSDILLIHAGSYGLSASASPLASLLDEVSRWEASANGHPVTVVVARIIDQNPSDPNISLFNNNVAALVRNRAGNPDDPAYPDDVLLADLYGALSYPHDMADQLHPNEQGYAKLADAWKDVVTDNLLLEKCP